MNNIEEKIKDIKVLENKIDELRSFMEILETGNKISKFSSKTYERKNTFDYFAFYSEEWTGDDTVQRGRVLKYNKSLMDQIAENALLLCKLELNKLEMELNNFFK